MYFGNLTIDDLERRECIEFSDDDKKWLEEHRQDNATVRSDSDKFHIFDLPFMAVVAPSAFAEFLRSLGKYSFTKECFQIAKAVETEEERLQKILERERKEFEKKKADPNQHWLKKWMLTIPVEDREYHFFINTEHIGYNTIPNDIKGEFVIYRNYDGLHGHFTLDDPSINKTEHPEWQFVVGTGMYKDGFINDDGRTFSFEGRIENHRLPEKDTIVGC